MNSDDNDITSLLHAGNICLWQMTIKLTSQLRVDGSTFDLANSHAISHEIMSLAGSLADDCSLLAVYEHNQKANVLGVFRDAHCDKNNQVIDTWKCYCDHIATLANKPTGNYGRNHPIECAPISLSQYVTLGMKQRFVQQERRLLKQPRNYLLTSKEREGILRHKSKA